MSKQLGFTYLGLMLLIAVAGIALAGLGTVWHTEVQREKEQELFFNGNQYSQAIRSYYDSTPAGIKQFPQNLQQLISDNRFPQTKRHLRKLYPNPFAEDGQWQLIKEQDRIIGVYADSEKVPLRRVFKSVSQLAFNDAKTYSAWRFTYKPGQQEVQQQAVVAAPVIQAPLGRPENLAKPVKPVIDPSDQCEIAAQADYAICRGVCQAKTFDVCKACYASLREREYACRRSLPITALVTSK